MIIDRFQYFLDDFWNFEDLVKSGPVDLLNITKMLQKIKETDGNVVEHIIFMNLGHKKLKMFERRMSHEPCFLFFEWLSILLYFICYKDEDRK